MNDAYAKSIFEPRLNQTFQAKREEITATLKLTKLVTADRPPKGFESFTMVFSGPREPFLEQATYDLTAEDGASIGPVFLVPVAGDDSGYDYEVVINRKLD